MPGINSPEKKRIFEEVEALGPEARARFIEIRETLKKHGEPARTAWRPAYEYFIKERNGEKIVLPGEGITSEEAVSVFGDSPEEIRDATKEDFMWACANLGIGDLPAEQAPSKIAFAIYFQGRSNPQIAKAIIDRVAGYMKGEAEDDDVSDLELTALEKRIVEGFEQIGKQIVELCKRT